MTIIRYNPDGTTCSETYCNTVTSVWNVLKEGLKIYPNPAGDKLFVELPEQLTTQSFVFKIEDIAGKQVMQLKKDRSEKKIEISLKHFVGGVYTLGLKDYNTGNYYISKFVKK